MLQTRARINQINLKYLYSLYKLSRALQLPVPFFFPLISGNICSKWIQFLHLVFVPDLTSTEEREKFYSTCGN